MERLIREGVRRFRRHDDRRGDGGEASDSLWMVDAIDDGTTGYISAWRGLGLQVALSRGVGQTSSISACSTSGRHWPITPRRIAI
jgi:hypothetical protein